MGIVNAQVQELADILFCGIFFYFLHQDYFLGNCGFLFWLTVGVKLKIGVCIAVCPGRTLVEEGVVVCTIGPGRWTPQLVILLRFYDFWSRKIALASIIGTLPPHKYQLVDKKALSTALGFYNVSSPSSWFLEVISCDITAKCRKATGQGGEGAMEPQGPCDSAALSREAHLCLHRWKELHTGQGSDCN